METPTRIRRERKNRRKVERNLMDQCRNRVRGKLARVVVPSIVLSGGKDLVERRVCVMLVVSLSLALSFFLIDSTIDSRITRPQV